MASKYAWTALKTTGEAPRPRSSHCLSVLGGKAFVFGGEHQPRTPIDSAVSALDLSSGVWEGVVPVHGTPPSPRVACSASVVPGSSSIYVFGGRSGVGMGEGSLDDLHVFDVAASRWTTPEVGGDLPPARSFHSSAAIGDRVFVFGGCGQDVRFNDLHVFDVAKSRWTKLPSCDDVTPRGGTGFVAIGDSLYVIGGFIGKEIGDTHVFNATTGTWSTPKLASPLPPRSVFGTCALGSRIIVMGGEVDPSDAGHAGAGQFTSDCYTWDTNDNSGWQRMEVGGDKLSPRGWFSAALWGEKPVVHGGVALDNSRLGDVMILSAV